jgi:transposase
MFESRDDTKVRRPRRVEVFTGPERRRDWPDERKIAIVAESLEPGVNASALARSHDINPQQLFGWRRRFRAEAEALIAASRRAPEPVSFAPVHVEAPASALPAPLSAAGACDGSIEITIGTATVRIRGAADTKTLALVLKALKEFCLPASGRTA